MTDFPFCSSVHGGEVVPLCGDFWWSGGEVGAGAALGELHPSDQSFSSCTISWCIFCRAICSGVLSILSAMFRLA